MAAREVRVLSFHAPYRCRNSGVCCSSNWPIPVEADGLIRLQTALATGRLRPALAQDRTPFETPPDAPAETPVVLRTCDGECVFHDSVGSCHIHSALGHDALPLACRQFPRVCVSDPRGVSVTLSHYCPTAAGLLREPIDSSSGILLDAPGFASDSEYIGLDAAAALPPLLREDVLMDWESWWEIERLAVQTLLGSGANASDALRHVRGAISALTKWSPGRASLLDNARDAFANPAGTQRANDDRLVADAMDAVPAPFRTSAAWKEFRKTDDLSTRRFLASHAFANWAIHCGNGLPAWLESIETAHAFLEAGAGVGHADLVLRHLVDGPTRGE